MSKVKKIVLAVSTISGTIIGVGLFSLPYITSRVGAGVMLGYFFILASLVILIHRLFAEVALKTPDFLRLPSYAKIYLGKWGRLVALISTILGLLGAILAYLIVGGEFLTNLLSPILGGNNLFFTFLYFLAGAILIFFGIKAIAKIEFWGLLLFFAVLVLILFRGKEFIDIGNFPLLGNRNLGFEIFFLPYGPILFSLWGAALIPEVEEILGEHKNLLTKLIPVSILIPALVYLFFIFLVTGITGPLTSQEAIIGLKNFLGNGVVSLALFFGLFTTFTSFIALGLTLKKVFWYDLKIPKNLACFIACFTPLLLFLIGFKDFIKVIGFVGGVMIAIEGILIILMYQKIKAARIKFLIYPLILLFVLGIIYEIIYLI